MSVFWLVAGLQGALALTFPCAALPLAAAAVAAAAAAPLVTGIRVDAEQFSRSRLGYYTGVCASQVASGMFLPSSSNCVALLLQVPCCVQCPPQYLGWQHSSEVPAALCLPCVMFLADTLPRTFTHAGLCLVSADTLVPAAAEDTIPITGYPEGSWINYASWSPDGKYITFTTRSPGEQPGGGAGSLYGCLAPLCPPLDACMPLHVNGLYADDLGQPQHLTTRRAILNRVERLNHPPAQHPVPRLL